MKVVGLSGAQGAGKSLLILELKARGFLVDDFRVSRAVQKQLGWESLDRVMEDADTMMRFQLEVFNQKYNRDLTLSVKGPHEYYGMREGPEDITLTPKDDDYKNEIILTERTFADIWAYTSQWVWRHHERGNIGFDEAIQMLYAYTNECERAQNMIYSGIILLPFMPHVAWENDPNRAAHQDVNTVYEDIERFVERKMPIDAKRITINTRSVAERADQVQTFLRTLT